MANSQTFTGKNTDGLCRGLDGSIIAGLCLTNISVTESEESETIVRCAGRIEAIDREGVYLEMSATAFVRKSSFKDANSVPVKNDFISVKDSEADKLYLRIMSKTDCASLAKVTDKYFVKTWNLTKDDGESWVYTVTLRREPDFQP